MTTLTGKNLGKYRLGERLGRGGMADVYRAPHPRLGRDVAIKTLHPHLTEGEGLLARFEREGQAIARLRHPHIVQIYDFDVEDEIVYMVMEFLDGGSLKSRLLEMQARREYLPLGEVARLVDEIGQALDFAHSHDILHRDIKPANVLLDRDGKAYLTDFGIVRILSESQFTATGSLIGTPAYMSPEQGKGAPLTPASDLYGLGVILYEMLTNRVPFDADTPLAVIHKQVYEPLPPLRAVRPELPEGIERVVAKALAKAPDDRYPSAQALVRDLRDALKKAGPAARESAAVQGPAEIPAAPAKDKAAADYRPTVAIEGPSEVDYMPTVALEAGAPEEAAESPPPPAEVAAMPVPQEPVAAKRAGRPKWIVWLVMVVVLAAAATAVALSGVLQPGEAEPCGDLIVCRDLALRALAGQQGETAIAHLDSALSRAPETEHPLYAELWCLRGQADQSLGRRPDAVTDYANCLEWMQGEPGLEDLRASAEHALVELGAGAEIACGTPDECSALAEGLIGEGRFEEAVAALDQGIAKVPEDQHPPNARLWCLRGDAHAGRQSTEEAVSSYRTCIGWTEGDPGLEALRQETEGKIQALQGG